jgi:hypothetical protein
MPKPYAVIKTMSNGDQIRIEDTTVVEYGSLVAIFGLLMLVAMFLLVSSVHIYSNFDEGLAVEILAIAFVIGGIGMGGILFGIGIRDTPGYIVYAEQGDNAKYVHTVPKVGSGDGVSQKAVCDAARDVEHKINLEIKARRDLEQIAAKCK